MAEIYERFRFCDVVNIQSIDWTAPLLSIDFGDGLMAACHSGHRAGLNRWTMSAEVMPDMDIGNVHYTDWDGEEINDPRFTYVFEFIKRHAAADNKPFIIQDPRTGKHYLVSFDTAEWSFQQITGKLFAGGIELIQRRDDDLEFGDDGEIISLMPVHKIDSGRITGGVIDGWTKDILFAGGEPFDFENEVDTETAANPAPDEIYETCRYGIFRYDLAGLPKNHDAKIRFHFADSLTASDSRIFELYINGELIDLIDIADQVGNEAYHAYSLDADCMTDANGNLVITVELVKGFDPLICGVETFYYA